MLQASLLAAEMAALFVVIPLLFYYRVLPNQPIPFLLLTVLVVYLFLRRDRSFDRRHLWKFTGVRSGLKPVLIRAAVLCTVIGLGVWLFMPDRLFSLVRRAPILWAVVMVLYPLVSVYPQEVFFRAFFFHRYRRLFGQGLATVVASAVLFGFVHIVFGHWISILLSGVGGFLFARTYFHSGSLALACIEHALYGNFIFTIGLGEFFFHGARR
ncbi:MAG: CPBP family intramembrane glutamic endopeptidase [Bryobacteraceae bacterium]